MACRCITIFLMEQPLIGPRLLASAAWADRATVEDALAYRRGDFWLGEAETDSRAAVGFVDDRHILIACGPRAGKGASVIVPNLAVWPGSVVCVDPKGENASLTADRRGDGAEDCLGFGQRVFVLDPYRAATVPEKYRARFNPLRAIEPGESGAAAKADALAAAIVLQQSTDAFWDDSARNLLKALILHVCSWPGFADDERHLLTVRRLIMRGAWKDAETTKVSNRAKKASAHGLLWQAMKDNHACGGVIADEGASMAEMEAGQGGEAYQGILASLKAQTSFMSGDEMASVLTDDDSGDSERVLDLADLKRDPRGVSLFISLPQMEMVTHFRWLRMMLNLIMAETAKSDGKPATGHSTLMILDEFAGLKKMESVETAAAQLAGSDLKMVFVVQTLAQLQNVYDKGWEQFVACAGTRIFFGVGDYFSRDYVSRSLGETEIVRLTQSVTLTDGKTLQEGEAFQVGSSLGISAGESRTQGQGGNEGWTEGESVQVSRNRAIGKNEQITHGTGRTQGATGGTSQTMTTGTSGSETWSRTNTIGTHFSESREPPAFFFRGRVTGTQGGHSSSFSTGYSRQEGWSRSTANGVSEGWSRAVSDNESSSEGRNVTDSTGRSDGLNTGKSGGVNWNTGTSQNTGTQKGNNVSRTENHGLSLSHNLAAGKSETLHVRPLIGQQEIERLFRRADRTEPDYPGRALVMVSGENPFIVRRTNYFSSPRFLGCFGAHPKHGVMVQRRCGVVTMDALALQQDGYDRLELILDIGIDDMVRRGQPFGHVQAMRPDGAFRQAPLLAFNDGLLTALFTGPGEIPPEREIGYQLLTFKASIAPDLTDLLGPVHDSAKLEAAAAAKAHADDAPRRFVIALLKGAGWTVLIVVVLAILLLGLLIHALFG